MAVLLSSMDDFALATLAARADEAGGPPPTKFYELRDNLALTPLDGCGMNGRTNARRTAERTRRLAD
jgi:hypothetical protein